MVHLLLGVKNTGIQTFLLRVLSSGIGVYLSPFKDVWGSRIIFAGPSKFFTWANKEQQKETVHTIYSVKEILKRFQQKLGLTYSVLEDVEVREIICGISSTEEIQHFQNGR